MSFQSFFAAIAQQESGGNYGAVNGRTGALGKYQILPGNIRPWSRQYLGREISPGQFLSSPSLQEALARAVLSSYYNQWGARGAASAWYSGSPTKHNNYNRFRSNEPSIGEYVDSIISKMGDGPQGPTVGELGPLKVVDKTVQQTALTPEQGNPLDQFSGLEAATGLGLEAADGSGLDKADGTPVGLEAADGSAPVVPQATFAQTFGGGDAIAGAPSAGGKRDALIDIAKQFLGTPYVWGGSKPGGFDCSGLIQYAMSQIGVKFPRVTWDQFEMGKRTSLDSLKPGDLVGFGSGGHIAIWLGNGQILEAPRTGLNVRIRTLGKNENTWGISLSGIFG